MTKVQVEQCPVCGFGAYLGPHCRDMAVAPHMEKNKCGWVRCYRCNSFGAADDASRWIAGERT